MKIIANNQEFHIQDQQTNSVTSIISFINQIIAESSMVFCGMKVDGEEIYDHFEELLSERESIQVIELILVTKEQLAKETLISIREYVSRALALLPGVVEAFYSGSPSSEEWTKLSQMIEGVQWIQNSSQYYADLDFVDSFVFTQQLEDLNTAVMQQDHTMIADIIQYEIITKYEALHQGIGELSMHEVGQHDAN
ncbi:hypothetical protein [Brevibacillus brevis]|uniref:hypothetical protein n=1 Tax=Brevibacillus brevis TaxID=1393 RepID=UPI001EDC842C|nr:hypothetical protein [Brevibacillus brevis]UKL00709.1 hypothetical protein FO446_26310 [Brevibacillus brevis]